MKKAIKTILIVIVVLFVLLMIWPEDDEEYQDASSQTSQTAAEESMGREDTKDSAEQSAPDENSAEPPASSEPTPQPEPDADVESTAAENSVEAVWNGDSAMDFSAQTNAGDTFTLSEQAGNVVLINFWATWCGPCVEEMPALQDLYEEYGDSDNVKIILINSGESSQTVHRFLSQNGYTMPCIYDTDNTVNDQYGIMGIPYTVIFNKDGTVAETYEGSYGCEKQYELYKEAIEEALSE